MAITASATLREFRQQYNDCKVKLPEFVNQESGEVFHSLAFVRENKVICLVGFSEKLGELTAEQIASQIDDLQVVTLESGKHKLCHKTQFDDSWQDVAI